jgi:hypothetical protein
VTQTFEQDFERRRAWREANREKRAEYQAAWRLAHKDEIVAYNRYYTAASRTKQRGAYALNPEPKRRRAKEFYARNREARIRATRAYERAKIGFTPEYFEEMLSAQEWCCAICGAEMSEAIQRTIAADHDHATGRPRGLLCNRCNRAIGQLGDTSDSVRLALDYLEVYA